MTKKTKINKPAGAGKKQEIKRNPDGTFPKGVSGNPEGKNAGTQHFKTMFIKAIEKIAKDTGEKAEDQEIKIVTRGILEARKGNFPFYKDVLDRVYGKAQQTIDHTTNGKDLPTPILGNAILDNNSTKKDSDS